MPRVTGSLGSSRQPSNCMSADDRHEPVRPRARMPAEQRPATATILIADDDDDSLVMMKTLLEFKGYFVLTARSGEETLGIASQERPDLIVLDLNLPSPNGLEVTRQLRRSATRPTTPIVIISGYSRDTHGQPAFDAGCDDYLVKPVDVDRLDQVLTALIPRKKIATAASGR